MPVGKIPQNKVLAINGVQISVVEAHVRYPSRKDLVLFEIADGTNTSGVFTQNSFCAAPIIICRENLALTTPKYLLINTGNANAGTGEIGLNDARKINQKLAEITKVEASKILPFSTGVTTEFLPTESIIKSLPKLVKDLKTDNWNKASIAIMTTDTRPKGISSQFKVNGETVTISGITKGSGMIKPNMATMLSFIATDAKIAPDKLDEMLKIAVNKSFNRITVDGDTSTNDACMLIATGQSVTINTPKDEITFLRELINLMQTLAQYMVRDAEGASKFITINVVGGKTSTDCLEVAYKIAHSPLVKTALFASDANVGRIMVAIGNAEVPDIEVKKIVMNIGGIVILNDGIDVGYREADLKPIMQQEQIDINIDLNMGKFFETVWTCDLSYDYVKINADYRT